MTTMTVEWQACLHKASGRLAAKSHMVDRRLLSGKILTRCGYILESASNELIGSTCQRCIQLLAWDEERANR